MCWGHIMAADRPSLFHCPNCNALYHVIKVDPGPETVDRAVTCRVCGESFASREGNAVLKYFLTRKPSRAQGGAIFPTKALFDPGACGVTNRRGMELCHHVQLGTDRSTARGGRFARRRRRW